MTEIEKNLEALAEQINVEHRACDAALRSGLRHAVNAGGLLAEAKERVNHGEWGSWLADNFEGSTRTAQAYMKVSREVPNLDAAKAQRVADLSFRGALAELSAPGDAIHREIYAEKWRPCEGGHEKVKTYYTIEEYASDHGYRVSPPLLIDPEYHEILPPHQPDEYAGLERSILREGCRDAIAACNNTILDGHARYEICTKHGIKFLVRDVEKSNRHECLMYIIDAQMGRVNLSYLEKAYARGKQEVSRIASEQGISEDQAFDEYMNETAPA